MLYCWVFDNQGKQRPTLWSIVVLWIRMPNQCSIVISFLGKTNELCHSISCLLQDLAGNSSLHWSWKLSLSIALEIRLGFHHVSQLQVCRQPYSILSKLNSIFLVTFIGNRVPTVMHVLCHLLALFENAKFDHFVCKFRIWTVINYHSLRIIGVTHNFDTFLMKYWQVSSKKFINHANSECQFRDKNYFCTRFQSPIFPCGLC